MNARNILALSVPIAFLGFIIMAIHSERLSEAGIAAVSALLGAIVNGVFNDYREKVENIPDKGNNSDN